MASREEELLKKPLYVFDLPDDILATIELKSDTGTPFSPEDSTISAHAEKNPEQLQDGTSKSSASCALCGVAFPTVQDQRSHVKSDFHGYNIKQKMRGLKAVNETEFEKLVGDLNESISGSDSSDTEDEEDGEVGSIKTKDSTLNALLKRQAQISNNKGDGDFAPAKRKRGSGKPPLLWFTTPVIPPNTSLGIYRALFTDAEQEEEAHLISTVRNKQLSPIRPLQKPKDVDSAPAPASPDSPHIFLCMVGGGHFAAMVVSLAPKLTKRTGSPDERQATVLAHKTFHRYTTRRKQGGAQLANDSAKGAAHSAGSSLRRYNETALTSEIRSLLSEWRQLIDTAQFLFIRATGSTNRRTLFGPYDDQVLRLNDPRVRGFPFSTRRATQAELMRAFVELTRVKVSRIDEAALAAAAADAAAAETNSSKPASSSSTPNKPSTVSKEEEALLLHTSQLQALIRRSKAPALLTYLNTHLLSPNFRFHPPSTPQNHHAPTPLHLAASLNAPAVVLALLTKAQADPTLRNDEGKTAFEIAGDRATRDAFRVARSELGEAFCVWDDGDGDGDGDGKRGARVPSALSKTEAEKRTARERDDEARAEATRRAAEVERLAKEQARREDSVREKDARRRGPGMVIGAGAAKTARDLREDEARGLTPEMRMRLERERRARAAEERMRRAAGGG
ncbi:MAG: hypothetical protein M1819_003994 [Sarea resinae]|nr:MAG: hypothetical protein M1819_003994 [Sarea resinae]